MENSKLFHTTVKLRTFDGSKGIVFGAFSCYHPKRKYNVYIDITKDNHMIITSNTGEDINNGSSCLDPDHSVIALTYVDQWKPFNNDNRNGSGVMTKPVNFRRKNMKTKLCSVSFNQDEELVEMIVRIYGNKPNKHFDRKLHLPKHCTSAINNIDMNQIINELNK